jgi:hypothetical protein
VLCSIYSSTGLSQSAPVEKSVEAAPADFTPSSTPGGGGSKYIDSPRFRIYNYTTTAVANTALTIFEAAYACFVEDLGWRSTGLTFNTAAGGELNNSGPYYKLNVYNVGTLTGAAANTGTESTTGLSFLKVVTQYLTTPSITVHEFGHALTYTEKWWINQVRTGAWWETIAQFVADTYQTNSVFTHARGKYNQTEGDSLIDINKVISDSFQ